MVRIFLAINLSAEQRGNISTAIGEWRTYRAGVRWVAPVRLHLTLKFFGDIRESFLGDVKKICRRVAERHGPFELEATVVGAFPTARRPGVLWVGLVSRPEQALHALQHDLEHELAGAGFSRDKKGFAPHITVGRVKSTRGITGFMKKFMEHKFAPAPFNVDFFQLYSSDLRPEGPIYRELASFPLNSTMRQDSP